LRRNDDCVTGELYIKELEKIHGSIQLMRLVKERMVHGIVTSTKRDRYSATVVVPTKKRPKLLVRALTSVVNAWQSSGPESGQLEVCVVDDEWDNSTQNTVSCLPYPESVILRYLRNPSGPNRGSAAARNYGVQSASSPFIYWLDDDDEFRDNRFEISYPILSSGKAEMVLERTCRILPDGRRYITGPEEHYGDVYRFLLMPNPSFAVAPVATSFRRDVFERVGGMRSELRFAEDSELLLRLCLHCKAAVNPGEPVANYYFHSGNTSGSGHTHLWHPIRALRTLLLGVDWSNKLLEKELLKSTISGMFDYSLHECRIRYSYRKRLAEGLSVMREFPFECMRHQNLKSMLVWLCKVEKSS